MTDTLIARTIIDQLGGGKFQVMTGAKAFIAHPAGLSFHLPGAGGFCRDGINHVHITLTWRDDYDVTFSRIRGGATTTIKTLDGISPDQLQNVFSSVTGLATSLGTMGRG